MHRPIYRAKDNWILCTCDVCGTLNYVEPHGITADCSKCKRSTEHSIIPYCNRDMSGCYLVKRLSNSTDSATTEGRS